MSVASVHVGRSDYPLALWKEQSLQLRPWVIGTHKGFADQKGIHLADFHQLDIGAIEDAALGHYQAIAGNPWQQIQGGLQIQLEGVQVTVVDAQQRRIEGLQRPFQFVAIVYLYQYIQI